MGSDCIQKNKQNKKTSKRRTFYVPTLEIQDIPFSLNVSEVISIPESGNKI